MRLVRQDECEKSTITLEDCTIAVDPTYLGQIRLAPGDRVEICERCMIHPTQRATRPRVGWIVALLVPEVILVVEHCTVGRPAFRTSQIQVDTAKRSLS